MKALTLYDPHASLMYWSEKNNETRSWPTKYRGPLAIHAAKSMPWEYLEFAESQLVVDTFAKHMNRPIEFSPGCVLCIRWLVDCISTAEFIESGHALSDKERAFGDYSLGRWVWVFNKDILPFGSRIQVQGHQRI